MQTPPLFSAWHNTNRAQKVWSAPFATLGIRAHGRVPAGHPRDTRALHREEGTGGRSRILRTQHCVDVPQRFSIVGMVTGAPLRPRTQPNSFIKTTPVKSRSTPKGKVKEELVNPLQFEFIFLRMKKREARQSFGFCECFFFLNFFHFLTLLASP